MRLERSPHQPRSPGSVRRGVGGTAGSEPPGPLPRRESPGARPQPGGCRAEATLGEVEARGARGRAGRTGRSSAADLAGAPARPIR